MAKLTKEEEQILIENYEYTTDLDALAKSIGRTRGSTIAVANRRGLIRKVNTKRIGTLEPFLSGTQESFYWLGMYVSDGHIDRFGHFHFSQSEKDKEQVYKLSKFLGTNVHIIQKPKKYNFKNVQTQYKVSVGHTEITNIINQRLGITVQKTYTGMSLDLFKNDPIGLQSFILGFIDGDGSVYNKRIVISCHENWDKIFTDMIDLLPDEYHTSTQSKKYYHSSWNRYFSNLIFNLASVRLLYEHAYKYKLPINRRKWDKFIIYRGYNYAE